MAEEEVVAIYEETEAKMKPAEQTYVTAQYDPQPELCRACAQPSKFMIDIFSERGIQLKLKDKINAHLPIKVRAEDILPLHMCTNCVLRLDAFHKMTEVCARADKKLRETLNCPARPVSRTEGVYPSTSQEDNVTQDTSTCVKIEKIPIYLNYDSAGNYTDTDFGSKSDFENNQENVRKKRKNYSKPQYKCPLCSEAIFGRVNFENHLLAQHKKYRCDDCHTLFDSKEDLYWHKDKHHKNECEICDIAFTAKRAMFDHFTSLHSDVQSFKCDKCDKAFPLKAMLAQHIRSHEVKHFRATTPYQCTICNKVLKSSDSFRGHRLVHLPAAEKNSFLCSQCGKGYPTACKLKYHMRSHTGEKPYQCKKCPKAFYSSSNLQLHARVHVVGRPFKCDHCERGFKHYRDLYTHRKERHLGAWKYKCRACNEVYTTIEEVKTHYNTHSAEETDKYKFYMEEYTKVSDHYCVPCDKYFLGPGALSAHNTRHRQRNRMHVKKGSVNSRKPTVKSDFMCDACGKYLSSKISLTVHLRTHMTEKPFKCITCGKGFILQSFLDEHTRIHTGETPFACEGCGKRFYRKNSLNIHFKSVHLNLRPHECNVCSKRFKTKGALGLHYRIHTGERPYECDICQKTFVQKPDRDRHRVRHDPSHTTNYSRPVPSTSRVDHMIQNVSKTVVNRLKKSKLSERIARRPQRILPREDNTKHGEESYDNLTIVQTGAEEYAICSNVPPADGHKVVNAEVEYFLYK